MNLLTIGGPFTKEGAEATKQALGEKNHSVYSTSEGYFVEIDTDIIPDRIFGLSWDNIQSIQLKRGR